MEQLLLKMNHTVDQANQAKEEYRIEAEMARIDKIKLEERLNYLRDQYEDLKNRTNTL